MDRIDDIEGRILQNRCVAPGHHLAAVKLARPMTKPRPGQFVMVRFHGADIFLRRPFSVYDYGRSVLWILYKVAGKGTSHFARMARGEAVNVLGPLGKGFAPLAGHSPVLVAGGIGIAGIHLLWKLTRGKGALFWGCTSADDVGLLGRIADGGPYISTIDGSFGCRGNVVDLLADHLGEMKGPIQVFACGPEAMYRSLAGLLEAERIPCQVLLEERMACGLGICFGCVAKTLDKKEPYKRVCKEGPVFDLWQISL
ncbi:MAG: dihydroorotate dehydrogenase electron transfer subunit [Syntrophorhabdales bacterium]|jgi:dihydroorotate dehydrogenase electron transfer subunit